MSDEKIDGTEFVQAHHGDVMSFLNLRDWLQKILEKEGCEITDAGLGSGKADLGFTHQGEQYGISIWPRIQQPTEGE
jgi:hypothetical protein